MRGCAPGGTSGAQLPAARDAVPSLESPKCTPIRTGSCSPAGHSCSPSDRCISMTADTQALNEENTAKKPSPCAHLLAAVGGKAGPDQGIVFGKNLGTDVLSEAPQ